MNLVATPLTAAAAGVFSAITWPIMYARFHDPGSTFDIGLLIGTILLVALPAHACVVGFKRTRPADPRTLDTALLKRAGAWIGAALLAVGATALLRGQ
jgi:hypothetical protein